MPSPWPRAPPGPPTAPPGPCCRPPRPPGHAWGAGPPELAGAAPRPPVNWPVPTPTLRPRPSAPSLPAAARAATRAPQLPPVNWVAPPGPPAAPPGGGSPRGITVRPAGQLARAIPPGPRRRAPPASPGPGPRGPRDRRRHVAAEPLALALRRHAAAHPAVPAVPPARRAKAPRAPSRRGVARGVTGGRPTSLDVCKAHGDFDPWATTHRPPRASVEISRPLQATGAPGPRSRSAVSPRQLGPPAPLQGRASRRPPSGPLRAQGRPPINWLPAVVARPRAGAREQGRPPLQAPGAAGSLDGEV
ncbi:hypothetical protein N7454_009033 [Penicillium verhagenii]|nr:hypothetical protein N7454_009033 [Penicillium verhagenii]